MFINGILLSLGLISGIFLFLIAFGVLTTILSVVMEGINSMIGEVIDLYDNIRRKFKC